MARPSNADQLRKLMAEHDLKRPAVLAIVRQAGWDMPKITLDSYLAKPGTKLYRKSLPEHVLAAVKDWCEKHGKRKKD